PARSQLAPVGEERGSRLRSPTPRGVVGEGEVLGVQPRFEHRHDDLPRALDRVPTGEERLIAAHDVADEPLVRRRRLNAETDAVVEVHVDAADVILWTGDLRFEAHGDAFVGLNLD